MENSNSPSGYLQLLPKNVLPTQNFVEWLDNDGFDAEDLKDINKRYYLEELHRVKTHFWEGIYNKSVLSGADGINLNPLEIYNLIDGYKIRIQKLRLIIRPEYSISSHLHQIKTSHGSKKVNYLVVRSYWIGIDGKKCRKFSKNLGAEDKVLINGQIPQKEMLKIREELVQMYWEQYKSEYTLLTIEPKFTDSEFNSLIEKIDLYKEDDYDCTTENIWSFHKAEDIREGISLKFGNMCNGFPFEIEGTRFFNSECAYIAGFYADNNSIGSQFQTEISELNNGLTCKRKYRKNKEHAKFGRKDFYDYNIEWMKFVVWQKCIQSVNFASLLKQIPIDAHIVENSTLQNGETSTFWGAKNKELMNARKLVQIEVEKNFVGKKGLKMAKILARNKINNIGHFKGVNIMGKILKMCSLCLIYDQQPMIDYPLLDSKKLYLLEQRLVFPIV